MRSRMVNTAIIFLLCILIPAVCYAGNVGKIAGTVVDKATGEPLKFANVVIIGTSMGAMAVADGSFLIINVAPGTYDVQASYIGYRPMLITGVVIEPDLTREIVFELEETAAGVTETIIVEAERPLVQVDVTSTRNIYLSEEIDALPVDNPANVINYVSGSALAAGGTHIRGGRATEVGYYIDDSPVQDPIANNAIISLTSQAVNEMVIYTGGFNAEYGNASSGIVNVITTEGTDEYHGAMEYRMYLPVQMFWVKSDTGDPLDNGEMRGRLSVTGPIFKQEDMGMKFALSMENSQWDDWQPRVEVLDRPGKQQLYNGVLSFNVGRTKLKGSFNIENDEHVSSYDAYQLYERIEVPETWRRTYNDNYRFALSLNHMLNDRSFIKASFSVLDGTLEIGQLGKNWDPALSFQENQDLYNWDLDIRRDDDNFVISGDNPYYDYQERRIYSFRGSYTQQIGRNEFKTGIDANFYDVQEIDVFASTANYYIYEYDVNPRGGALYVQDKLEFEGLIMNLGLRLDAFDPNSEVFKDFDRPYDLTAPDSLWHGPDNANAPIELERYDPVTGEYLGGGLEDASVKWKLSPRIGASYPITETSYLHMQYGHFMQLPSFDYMFENQTFHTRGRWLVAGNADLEPEKTVAYEIGVNHLLSTNTAIDFTFFYKDITDMTEQVIVGPLVESNPQAEANYVTFMNMGYGNTRGFEINLKRRSYNNWRYHAAYTFMVARGFSSNVNEGGLRRFDDEVFPTQQFYLDWDRRHSFLLNTGYAKQDNWSIDVAASYATGAPYTDPVRLSRMPVRNNARYPDISNVDVQMSKIFMVQGLRTEIFLRVLNLFDQRNIISWNDVDQDFRNWLIANPGDYLGPFGDFTIYGQPRNIIGGVKLSF